MIRISMPSIDTLVDGLRRWAPLVLAIIIGLGAMAALTQCINSRQRAATAGVEGRQAAAGASSAADATNSVAEAAARAAAIDDITRENDRAINSAPGASAPVDPRLRDAGLDSLCRRASYRADPACVQRAAARSMAATGKASAAARR